MASGASWKSKISAFSTIRARCVDFGITGDVAFDRPSQHDLRWGAAVLACDAHDGRVPERLPAGQRAIGLEGDLQPVAVFEERAAELKRRELDLVDVGPDATAGNKGIELARTPVADADGAGQPVVVRAFQSVPLLGSGGRRPVDEEEVDMVHTQAPPGSPGGRGPGRWFAGAAWW